MGTLYILGIFPPKTFRASSWSRKMELSRAKGASEHVFARPFREKPLSRAKPTVSTADQLFRHHKHEVKPPSRRNMSGICGKLQCGILETARICGYSRFGTQERCETPSIFRGIFRNTKLSNTSCIPKDIPEYLRKANSPASRTQA